MEVVITENDFIGSVFGEEGQLTVVAWDGRRQATYKLYKAHCNICAGDPELFGDGCFYSTKKMLQNGLLPCGCSSSPRWTEDQYKVRIERKCKELGDLEFLGFIGSYKKAHTKLKLQCNKHAVLHVYESNTIKSLLRGQMGCHVCKNERSSIRMLKPDQEIIDSFFASGSFKEGAKFWRSSRVNSQGAKNYWNYTCPVCSNDEYVRECLCSGVFEAAARSFQTGIISCRCSVSCQWTQEQREYQINKRIKKENLPYKFLGWVDCYSNPLSKFRYGCEMHGEQYISVNSFLSPKGGCPQCSGWGQQECYINGVYDNDILVALKFGIANNSKQRIKNQNRECVFDVNQLKVFSFPSVDSCKAAEAACKEELVCGILSKQEMPDGYTETTSPLNIDKIIEIYKRFDGIENK